MPDDRFYTFHEYLKTEDGKLSASMEDYIEMIYRLSTDAGFTRIHELSGALHVRQSSATKMVQRLAQRGYIQYQKYGFLKLEPKGERMGKWLLERHHIIEQFLQVIGVPDSMVLDETEKTEHMFSARTVLCLKHFLRFLTEHPEWLNEYRGPHSAKT